MARVCTVALESTAPYSQSQNFRDEKKKGETDYEWEQRTWRKRLHVNGEGRVFIPPMAFKKSLTRAAQHASERIVGKGQKTWGASFQMGILVVDPLVLSLKVAPASPISGSVVVFSHFNVKPELAT